MPAAKAAARTPPNHRYRVETGGCPIEASLDVLGGRWKGLLLFYIGREPQRFHELRKRLLHVSQRMLVRQLRELERDGLILRKIEAGVPAKVEYSATTALTELWPLLNQLRDWGAHHVMQADPNAPGRRSLLSQNDAPTPDARRRRAPR
jgi:DNA-binding HxlR family transcriptional regulator